MGTKTDLLIPILESGKFIISLDFELLWGVRDKRDIVTYGDHILGVYEVLPRVLELFRKYDVKVTFASVGMLFADGIEALDQYLPLTLPPVIESGSIASPLEITSLASSNLSYSINILAFLK